MILRWKSLKYFPYDVFNFGSLRRNRNGSHCTYIGRTLTPAINSRGYLVTILNFRGKRKTVCVHALVAEYFIGKRKNKLQVNHIDGNKLNNCVSNLEYLNNQDNLIHARKLQLKNKSVKLSKNDVLEIRELAKIKSIINIAKLKNISVVHTKDIIERKKWRWL